MSNENKTQFIQEGMGISQSVAVPLTQQISTEGYNLKIKNQAPPPRPTTSPVNPKKS